MPMSLSTRHQLVADPVGSAGSSTSIAAVEAVANLRRGVEVRVVPEQPRVGHDELVAKLPPGGTAGWRVSGHAVHLDRDRRPCQ